MGCRREGRHDPATIRRVRSAQLQSLADWPSEKLLSFKLYLLRFMERLPPKGAITAFGRSWYGRVLVERIEELVPAARWEAAYREINSFERMISDDGTRLVKLFFHISPEEQLRRFEARLNDPLKRWKLSYDDFRNRGHWDDYVDATGEMFARTSTRHAPWCLIAAEDKKYARIAALTEIAARLSGCRPESAHPGRCGPERGLKVPQIGSPADRQIKRAHQVVDWYAPAGTPSAHIH